MYVKESIFDYLDGTTTGMVVILILFVFFIIMVYRTWFGMKPNRLPKGESTGLIAQAHERMTLFLERNRPASLISRIGFESDWGLREFQWAMIQNINEEWNYNVSQQVYINPKVWKSIQAAKDALTIEINVVFEAAVPKNCSPKEVALLLLQRQNRVSEEKIDFALLQIKTDFQNFLNS